MSKKQSKKIVLTLFIALMLACGTSPGKPVYENEDFSINLPEGWLWGGDYWGAGTQVFSVRNPGGMLPSAVFSVAKMIKVEGYLAEELIEQAYQQHGSVDLIEARDFEIDDHNGMEYILYFGRGSANWKVREIWLERENAIYIICMRVNQSQIESYNQIFEKILESLAFKGE